MKPFTEAFLDRWEASATKTAKHWKEKPPPKWIAAFHPDWFLLPTQCYTLRLYVRQTAFAGLPGMLAIVIGWFLPLAYFWWNDPSAFQQRRYHKLFVGFLSHEGFYLTPWMMLFCLAFTCLFYLPRFYFWNRRAERLRHEPPLSEAPVEATTMNADVWPPPPQRPAA